MCRYISIPKTHQVTVQIVTPKGHLNSCAQNGKPKNIFDHVDMPVTPPSLMRTNMVFTETPPPALSTWFMNDPIGKDSLRSEIYVYYV